MRLYWGFLIGDGPPQSLGGGVGNSANVGTIRLELHRERNPERQIAGAFRDRTAQLWPSLLRVPVQGCSPGGVEALAAVVGSSGAVGSTETTG
jgi:hypothetical protein